MELNTILNLLGKYNLSADELLLIYLTVLAQHEEKHVEYFNKWYENGGQSKLKELFLSLKEKGIIKKNYNPDCYNPNKIEFNQVFLKGWFKHSLAMGQELFDAYEPFIYIKGKYFPLRNIAKRFVSLEEFFFHYSVTIGHSLDKHHEIMELLQWGKENNLITYSVLEFVVSQKWSELKHIRENGLDSQIADSSNLFID